MKRIVALLVGVAAVVLVASRPVAAAPGAPERSAAISVPADAVGLVLSQVQGAGLAVTLDAGGSEEHDLVVSNHTADLRLTIKLTATDATGNLGSAAASWLAFGDDAIQLEPHVATTVPMTIAVPHDTQPGSALAHVTATVESAVAAADGSPVAGTARQTFPVSIDVRGTPTAQIAIADVHRVDEGSHHQLALVLRNFGQQGAQVSGHVVVAGTEPQTLPFQSDLAPSRDTTVNLGWKPPPTGSPTDIAVDLEYGGGNVASWSSRLGGAPTDLSPPTTVDPTPTTSASATTTATDSPDATTPAKPWWKQPFVTVAALLALLGAGAWFGFEMRASRRRREGGWVPDAGRMMAPPGWVPGSSEESIDLARQLVRLTEVVVELVASHRDQQDVAGERARARSPDERGYARAGPAPPPLPYDEVSAQSEVVRSAPTTPSAVARPDASTVDASAEDSPAARPVAGIPPGIPRDEVAPAAASVAEPVATNLATNRSDEEIATAIVAAVSVPAIPSGIPRDEVAPASVAESVAEIPPEIPRDEVAPAASASVAEPVATNLATNRSDEEIATAIVAAVSVPAIPSGNPRDGEIEATGGAPVREPAPASEHLHGPRSDQELAAAVLAAASVPGNPPGNPRDGEFGGVLAAAVEPDDELVAQLLDHLAGRTPDDAPEPAAPESDKPIEAEFIDDDEPAHEQRDHEQLVEQHDDPRVAMMQRIADLDRARRRLRDWMDAEESGEVFDPPDDWYLAATEESGPGTER